MRLKKIFNNLNLEKIGPFIFSGLASLFSILTSLLIARPLGNVLYGQIQYYIGLITTIQAIIKFGIGAIMTKNAQFEKDKKAFFTRYILLFDVISCLGIPIFIGLSFGLLSRLDNNVILMLLIYLGGYVFAYDFIVSCYLLSIGKATLHTFIGSFLPKFILFVVAIVVLYTKGADTLVDTYIYIYIAAYLLSALPYSITLYKKTNFRFSKKEISTLVVFEMLTMTQSINGSLSRVIQGQYDVYQEAMGKSYNGILGLSMQIVSMAIIFGSVITTLQQPVFAKYAHENDNEGLIKSYRQSLRVNAYIAIPFLGAMIIESKNILDLFGSSYNDAESIVFFCLVAANTFVIAISGPDGTLLNFAGHEKTMVINGIISFSLFSILAFSLKTVTIYGIPIALLSSSILIEILKWIEMIKFYHVSPIDYKTGLVLIFIAVLTFLAFFPLKYIDNKYIWAIVNVAVGLSIIILNFILTPFKKDKYFFRKQK